MVSDVELAMQRLQAGLDELGRCSAEIHRWAGIYQERGEAESAEAKQELADFARSPQAPPQLRKLQEQIDSGALSWYSALLGEADAAMDPSALRFLQERIGGLPAMAEALRSGASAQEAAEALEEGRPL